ncbi:ABC transporter ATP-binding protein [Candidatus Enterococcus leclercqii]|uniref:ABC transporter ATP-binding protein n=1 Tax=Candidatus Enterococcus leclercqii TaxID=1857218 RepID=UPI0013796067|nr:ABC transporter ATP-binding protein [Enterococcus sp. CU9D]KAF1291905.1 ABC transporter ATP-binding protein [Enterococcus sp. CU9D]
MSNVLELSNIWKRIGKKMIIKNVAFTVEKGQIVGLLGPNGAGKTTLIRVIVSLMQLDQGNIMINGISLSKDYKKAIAQVGAIIENPEFYNYMSGYDNLMQYVRMARKEISKKEVDDVVKAVHLENNIDQKVKTYSLGMRQRLGVAQALLHKPALLVLDEPMNGLDPKGMREFREMMLALRDQGISVLVSSHQLSDIEQIADHLVILQKGEVTHRVSMAEIKNGSGNVIELITSDNAAAEKLLAASGFLNLHAEGDKVFVTTSEDRRSEIAALLVKNEIGLLQLNQKVNSLEDVFLEWTEEGGL